MMPDIGDRMSDGGYKKLDVYRLAHGLAVRIHKMTLKLPSFEKYEEGAQVRRSSKRVSSSIVEGYAIRKYKALFLSYLYRALGSADESQEHLRFLIETSSVSEKEGVPLLRDAEEVSRKMMRFIQATEREHNKPRETGKPAPPTVEEEPPLDPEAAFLDSISDIRNLKSRG